MTTTEAQFSIAEKEEVVARLRETYARKRHEAELADIEKEEANKKSEAAWVAVHEARLEYDRCDRALVEQMAASL